MNSRPDLSILRDLVAVMTERLVGTTVSVGPEGTRITGTIVAVDVEPVDGVSAQVEAGLDAWATMNEAALRSLDRIDPLGAGLRMFGAAVSGFEKVLDAGPVNPVEGVAKVARRVLLDIESVSHPRWRASCLRLRCVNVRTSFDVGASTIRASDVRVVAILDEADLAHSVAAMGWGDHDIRIVDTDAFVVRRVGPITVWLPVDVEVTGDDVVVGVSTVRVGRWHVDLPERVARSWRRARTKIAGPLDLATIEVADGAVTVSATAAEVHEPVTAAQLSGMLRTLQGGAADLKVERIRPS